MSGVWLHFDTVGGETTNCDRDQTWKMMRQNFRGEKLPSIDIFSHGNDVQ